MYDADGNLRNIIGFEPPNPMVVFSTTMAYDKENRMTVLDHNGVKTTYTSDGDGEKLAEHRSSGVTTIVWDGVDYLEERT